jgi:hypothetical protein
MSEKQNPAPLVGSGAGGHAFLIDGSIVCTPNSVKAQEAEWSPQQLDIVNSDDPAAQVGCGDPVTWGYALTAHKAQGSQWADVLVIDESRYFHDASRSWLYTAITRAAESVTVTRIVP